MTRKLYSVADVAAELDVSQSDVRRAVADGAGQCHNIAGRLVFDEEQLRALEETFEEDDLEDNDEGEDEDGAQDEDE